MITHPDYTFIAKAGEHTSHGVMLLDISSQKFEYVNARFLSVFELAHESLFDFRTLIRMVHEEDVTYLKSGYRQLQKTGFIDDVEFRVRVNGTVKHIHCYMMLLEGNRLTAFIKDVSEQKHHEDYLVKYSAQKDTMLDMLTHNLSGSLQLSQGLIDSMEKGLNGDSNGKGRHLQLIRENTRQCIEIVNDFLRKEHYESLSTEIRVTRFDLAENIQVIIDQLKELNPDKQFTFSCHGASQINSDAVKFFQVMHNILSNAIKFTGNGGKISVKVEERESWYTVSVKDNGIGIPDIIRPMIFKGRVMGRTGLKGEKSSGLGLSIAAKLLRLVNGKIWFDSEEGMGSTFFIELPKSLI